MKALYNTLRQITSQAKGGDVLTFISTPTTVKTTGEAHLPLEDWVQHTKAGSLYTEHSAVEDPILIAERPQTFEELKIERINHYQKIYKKTNNETY